MMTSTCLPDVGAGLASVHQGRSDGIVSDETRCRRSFYSRKWHMIIITSRTKITTVAIQCTVRDEFFLFSESQSSVNQTDAEFQPAATIYYANLVAASHRAWRARTWFTCQRCVPQVQRSLLLENSKLKVNLDLLRVERSSRQYRFERLQVTDRFFTLQWRA